MHENTKKLRKLMKQHQLRAADVAAMLGRQDNTVRVWRVKETQRVIPDDALELLGMKLAQRSGERAQ